MIDDKFFFDTVRVRLFHGTLSQEQVDGMNVILAEWQSRKLKDLRWLAYPLATTYHETMFTMQPINEMGGPSYFTKLYDIEGDFPARARQMGNIHPGDGIKYHGRGFVQLTWANNYRVLGDILKIPLLDQPELALNPVNAARILFEGMLRGLFTGHALPSYFNDEYNYPIDARQVVNGIDHATEIAVYHNVFMKALGSAETLVS
jgi:putative chitinase